MKKKQKRYVEYSERVVCCAICCVLNEFGIQYFYNKAILNLISVLVLTFYSNSIPRKSTFDTPTLCCCNFSFIM